ncbi:ABC transporter ATP-binding protein [Truepera radiovictrix]|uniref:ABC transporter related protein n=1 Tax=Truepera radiovictrix (strain DSM 17093 / CIP 108686 / LMG 22925 / RQ-24) TaxID=649638 RepID=D7CQL5_TRURR|nr:ABC transporter ATP-binding protein [Truepera radiovictrix]ADI14999.1 ABC transporter related protein [Truepera radiovictrix DSM 17093]WMT58853.1 ABC transporter ATP-binding protein [Truepera radiovictrix]
MLSVEGLGVRYGAAQAVSEVSFTVAQGEVVTLIGPNGAGKTTTLLALLNLLPHSGVVRYRGAPTRGRSPEQLVGEGLTLVPEKRELFASMSVEDNLRLGAFARRASARTLGRDLEEVYALFPRLLERRRQLAGTMSGGEQQMLAVGRALMSKPQLLMLDEPSLGLAPLIVRELFEIFARLKAAGTTILLVEQNARAALELADRGFVLEAGEVVLEGEARELLNDPRVMEAYLGLAAP